MGKKKSKNICSSLREHFEVILDSISEGVFTVDPEFTITFFNRSAGNITGIDCKQALGQKCFDVFYTDLCQTDCPMKKTLANEQPITGIKANIIDENGRIIPIDMSTAVLRDSRGNIVGGVEIFRDLSAMEALKKEITGQYTFHDIVSRNNKIQRIFNILPDIAVSDSTVLIEGPSGSGKELFARAIHNLSDRKHGPYVVVNCGALPSQLLESELFGYVRGAFTDAKKDKPGRFALAEGGTIFLDEIDAMPPFLQVKLLRVLQQKEYSPLGSTKTFRANVRVISASNRKLANLVKEGEFRDDLYYRLNIIKLELPPLKDRKEDIPLLVSHFIRIFNLKKDKNIKSVSPDVLEILMKYDYPGNIRELENIIEYAFVMCHGQEIEVTHLPDELVRAQKIWVKRKGGTRQLREAEAVIITQTLEKHGGSRARTAAELGIDKSTLWRKMKKYGITFPA